MAEGPYQHELTVAITAARAAGKLLLEEFHRLGGPRGKPGKCPADEHAEGLIHEHLDTAFPAYGFCGEELPELRHTPRDQRKHSWIVDPNDGTICFQRGQRGSAVSIALLRDHLPVLGVIYSCNARAGRGDLLTWAEGDRLLRNGQIPSPWDQPPSPWDGAPSPWDKTTPMEWVLLSADANRKAESYIPLCTPASYLALPSIAYRLALAAISGHSAALSTYPATRELDVVGSGALLRGAGYPLLQLTPRPQAVRFSGDGLRPVGHCIGGAPSLTHRLASRAWKTRKPALPHTHPYDLLSPKPGKVCTDPELLERAQGCLLGQCLGDSLGDSTVSDSTVGDSTGAHHAKQPTTAARRLPGQPGDAGEAALLLARCIATTEGYSSTAAATTYSWWRNNAPREKANPPDPLSRSALARAAPLGIYGHSLEASEVAALAHQDAALNDPHLPGAGADASAAYCVALAIAVREGPDAVALYQKLFAWARTRPLHPQVLALLESTTQQALHPRPEHTFASQDPLLAALAYAFRQSLRTTEPATTRLLNAARHGHPLKAVLTGALLGAMYGTPAWPESWLNPLLSCRPLAGAPGCGDPRPRACWPVDCLELAERVAWLGYKAA